MAEPGEWKFSQCFGEKSGAEDLTDADVLSAVEFDSTGNYLATGDKGGRVVLFENTGDGPTNPGGAKSGSEYKFYCEFQSHEAEFDYLKSLEIEEKINKIKWCKPQNNSQMLLSTNDKTIKLWKVHEKQVHQVSEMNLNEAQRAAPATTQIYSLKIPKMQVAETVVTANPRRVYANAHAYHINSISLNSDGETFLSADDLRINVWNLDINDQSFNVVDIKPANMEELTEVITAADFHPTQCNIMVYSSSRGSIKLGDMRDAALCDNHTKLFEEEEDPANKSFFSEIIASISDVKFTSDGRYIISRDYLTLKLWDLNMEAKPVKTIQIHEHLRSKLCDLYENDCIFDKFECSVSGDGNNLVTGSYNNFFHIYDRYGQSDIAIEAAKQVPRRRNSAKGFKVGRRKQSNRADDFNVDNIDFGKKVLHLAWHPQQPTIAVAGLNNLYIYSQI